MNANIVVGTSAALFSTAANRCVETGRGNRVIIPTNTIIITKDHPVDGNPKTRRKVRLCYPMVIGCHSRGATNSVALRSVLE